MARPCSWRWGRLFLAAGAGFLAGGITISWKKHSGQQPARVAPIRTTSVYVSCAQFKIAAVTGIFRLVRNQCCGPQLDTSDSVRQIKSRRLHFISHSRLLHHRPKRPELHRRRHLLRASRLSLASCGQFASLSTAPAVDYPLLQPLNRSWSGPAVSGQDHPSIIVAYRQSLPPITAVHKAGRSWMRS